MYDPKILEPTGCERLRNDNLLLYVARTSYLNGTVVGKFCPYMGTMYFGYDGVELSTGDFEVTYLKNLPQIGTWFYAGH